MATKKYLDYAGLKRVLAKLLPGARKIWHGTLAEWEALSATEKAKYDQAEVIDDDTGVPVVVDKIESGNMNPVTSNAVADALPVVVDEVVSGNMNPVTSNAVAEALPVAVDEVVSGNMNPVTSNAVAEALDDTVTIKSYNNVFYNLAEGESSQVGPLQPTGWFDTNLKVNVNKVAVVIRYVYTYNSNDNTGGTLAQLVPYNASTDADTGNLRLQFLNLRSDTQECVRCRVWFSLIGKAKDLPTD